MDVQTIENYMKNCQLCPRRCGVNRLDGELGYCGQDSQIKAARAALHMWEEPCISGMTGSGTVFFSGCTLSCVYCQNHQISDGTVGKQITIERLADIFLELQEKQACNINLVTATQFVPQIIAALDIAKSQGLQIPVVYNTSGYERIETLKMLEGYVDIYLPDLKYLSTEVSEKYSFAKDYPQVVKKALKEMLRQVGPVRFDKDMIQNGMIVRHLVLPEGIEDSKQVVQYLYTTYGNQIYVSIMNQYTPVKKHETFPELNRKITEEEYDEVVDFAIEIGVEQGFIQEGETAEESFIPSFDITGI